MSKKKHTKIEGMNLGNDDLTFEKEKSSKTLSDFLNKKTITITAMSAMALSGAFLATNVEAQEAVRTTFNEVSVSVMKTRHSSDFDGKDEIQSDETIQKESSSALGAITATWTDNTVEEIKAEIERQREAGLSAYIVQWGDTLSVLAEALGVSVEYLVELNNISDRHLILTGDILVGVLSNNMVSPNGSETERTISEEELNKLLELEEIEQIVQEIDTDGDGIVSVAEARAAGIELPIDSDHWLYPYMKDVNEDGVIDGKDLLVEFDKDANDKLSQDELDDADLIIDPTDDNDDWLNDYLDDDVIDDDNQDDDVLDENEDDTSDDDNQDDNNPDDNANDDNPDDNSPDDNDNQDDNNSDDNDNQDDDISDDAPNINDDLDDDIPNPDVDPDDPTDVGQPDEDTPGGPIIESPDDDDIKDPDKPDDEGGIIITDPDEDEEDDVVSVTGSNVVDKYTDIPYKTIKVDDPNLDVGLSEIDVPGVPGTLVTTLDTTHYSDGTITEEILKEDVQLEPVDEVIRVGTRPIIDPLDESLFTKMQDMVREIIKFDTVYKPDAELAYGEPVVEQYGSPGEKFILMEYTLNGLGERIKGMDETIKDPFIGMFGDVDRESTEPTQQIVRINPDELADIESGKIDPPSFDITAAPDPENPDDLEDVEGEELPYILDEDGNQISYDDVVRNILSIRPIVSDLEKALELDPTYDVENLYNGSPLVTMLAPSEIPVLAGMPIDLGEILNRLGRDLSGEIPEGFDLSPLDDNEVRYFVVAKEGEETFYEDVFYLDGKVVHTIEGSDMDAQASEYFIGKSQAFMDEQYGSPTP